jgi:RNA polymerase sigma factor (sigma-70 family)
MTTGASDEPSRDLDAMPGSFVEIWQRWRLPMVQLAVMLVDSREAAEDVVQEAFIGLHRRQSKVDNPEAYLRTSVVNGCRSVLRRRRTARVIGPVFSPAAPDVVSDVLLTEEHRETMRAVHRLPRRQREVLVLRYWHELTDEQIAQSLGLSPSTVRATASRARATLAQMLTDAEPDQAQDGGQR